MLIKLSLPANFSSASCISIRVIDTHGQQRMELFVHRMKLKKVSFFILWDVSRYVWDTF